MKISKKLMSAIVTGSILVGVTTGAFAAEAARQITATLDPSISVSHNGTVQNLKDANGNAVYPITYNGSTYLPVRAVSDVLGVAVDWDGPSKTVILGGGAPATTPPTTPETPASTGELNLATAMGAGNTRVFRISDSSALTEGGRTFSSGIQRVIWNATMSTSKSNVVMIDVTGKTTLTFTGWADVDADLLITDENANVIESFSVKAGEFIEREVDITSYDKIAFGANAQKFTSGNAKFFDPIAK